MFFASRKGYSYFELLLQTILNKALDFSVAMNGYFYPENYYQFYIFFVVLKNVIIFLRVGKKSKKNSLEKMSANKFSFFKIFST